MSTMPKPDEAPRNLAERLQGRPRDTDELFDIFVDFQDEPYAVEDITEVSYLVFDAQGEMAARGVAQAVDDGHWTVELDVDTMGKLSVGSNRLEVIVVSKLVALPSLATFPFVTE